MSESASIEAEREHLDQIRRRVMNVVGHALRTPMATLRGQVEVLVRTDDPQRREELTAGLLVTARRLERLLDDVLVASEIDTRMPVGDDVQVRVRDEVQTAWAMLTPDTELVLDVEDDRTVVANRDALRWVLRHYLDNAARYGEAEVSVRATDLDTDAGGTRIVVSSRPRWPITDEELDSAFELFYRGEGAVMDSTSAMGVGLTVAGRVAERMGWRVDLRRADDDRIDAILDIPA